jgi:hypothetical protein
VLAGCGEGDADGRKRITGHVVAPGGIDLSATSVLAWRGGQPVPWQGESRLFHWVEGRLEFDICGGGEAPVDLVVGALSFLAPDGLEAPRPRADRQIYSVEGHWGFARAIRPGTSKVVIHLERFTVAPLRVRALDLDGSPAAGCAVRLTLAPRPDWIQGVTGSDGVAAFEDVPVAPWTVEVSPPPEEWSRLLLGRLEASPAGQQVDVQLREAVRIRVRVRGAVPEKAFLVIGAAEQATRMTIGWRGGVEGEMDVPAEPSWTAVSDR